MDYQNGGNENQNNNSNAKEEINLSLLTKNIWFILIFCLCTSVLAFFYFKITPKVYRSTSTLMVIQNTPTQTLDMSVLSVAQQLAETFTKIASTAPVLQEVASDLDIPAIDKKNIDAKYILKTQLIQVSVKSSSPELAAKITDQLVVVLKNKIDELQNSVTADNRAMLEIVERAIPNEKPVFPKQSYIALVLLISLFIAISIVYLGAILDTSIDGEEKVFELLPNIPIIGTVPFKKNGTKKEILQEAVNELRTNLSFLRPDNPPKSIVITSAEPSDGKTFIAIELAESLAKSDKKVLLIDCDLRRAGLTHQFKLKNDAGMVNVLAQREKDKNLPIKSFLGGNLHILVAGSGPKNSGELIASKKAGMFFASLKNNTNYDIVIIDTPPIGAVADAAAIAAQTDGAIVIIEAGKTTAQRLKSTHDSLKTVKADLLGIIINKKKHSSANYGYKYRYDNN